MSSGKIPFPEWPGGSIAGRVNGIFNFSYYLKEDRKIISSYEPLPAGQVVLDFNLAIEKTN